MSLTVADILDLPAFQNADVIAGRRNLGRMVTSVSVLEHSDPNKLLDDFLVQNTSPGSEVILTAFSSIRNDIDLQCKTIVQMAAYGEVAIFLYYVGIVLPKIDKKLIETAEQKGMVLVCMEKNNLALRYSDGISDIMEQVIANRKQNNFEGEMLSQVSLLPVPQRTIQSVLSLLRSRIKATLVIRSLPDLKLLNIAASPESFESEISSKIRKKNIPSSWWIKDFQMKGTEGPDMVLSIINTNGRPFDDEVCIALQNVIQLFLNIWNPGHGQMVVTEMIKAILKDEPVKMNRLGELFNINVASLNEMWIIPQPDYKKRQKEKAFITERLKNNYKQVICDDFEENTVAFTNDYCLSTREEIADLIKKEFQSDIICCARNLRSTNMVRKVYLYYAKYLPKALLIFPKAKIYSLALIDFAEEISETLNNHHNVSLLLGKTEAISEKPVLLESLSVFLLDCNHDIKAAADQLHVHPNTLKYRLGQAEKKLGINMQNRFEILNVSKSLAVIRLMKGAI